MRRCISTLLAAAVAVTGTAVSFAPASAAMPFVSPAVVTGAGPVAGIEEIRDHRDGRRGARKFYRSNNYSYRHRGNNYKRYSYRNYRNNNYKRYRYSRRYHDRDNGSAVALGIFGLAAGAIVGSQLYGGYGGSSYDAACFRKYNSYDPYSKTYLGYDGYRHRCVLP